LYASAPNREASRGDQIFLIDPDTGTLRGSYRTDVNPRLLSLSDDASALFYSSGAVNNRNLGTFSQTPEGLHRLDLASGEAHSAIASATPENTSTSISDFAILSGQSHAVAAASIVSETGVADGAFVTVFSPFGLFVYDDPVPRPESVPPLAAGCGSLIAATSPSQVYCSNGITFTRFAVDDRGISRQDSFPLLPGRGSFGHMVRDGNRFLTTTGSVVDPEQKRTLVRVDAEGPVTVDAGTMFWLDPNYNSAGPTYTLKSFDRNTFQATGSKLINVTALDSTRLVSCGQGRLAFNAGHEIYLVHP
jgi:hypothetical protein